MRRIKVKYDWLLFAVLMVFLFAPIIQKSTDLFKFKPLGGVIEPTPKPELSLETYSSNAYQPQIEKYASENFGFREPVIRIYNQYLYSAFHKTYCHYILPGKKDWLYYKAAVYEYYGLDLKLSNITNREALEEAETEVNMMNQLRQVLKEQGITFLAFIAPDKTRVYPEYLPRYDFDTAAITIADYYDRRLTELDFPHINMTKWFEAIRDTMSVPLFSTTDSHWDYSAILGFDSLFRYMNALGEPDFPRMHIGPAKAYHPEEPDGDESTLNLLFRIPSSKTKYKAEITLDSPMAPRKPRVLFVGDSFIWAMETMMPQNDLMDEREIWFYNNTAFVGMNKERFEVKEINRLRHILKADYVVFYASGHQWREATFGFVGDALKQFEQASEADIAKARAANDIERDKTWLSNMKVYASKNGLSLEDALLLEADNLLNGRALLRENMVIDTAEVMRLKKEELIENWRFDPNQMKRIEEKAEMNGVSIEEMLELDAQWVVRYLLDNGELF